MTEKQIQERLRLTKRVLKDLKLLGLSPHMLNYNLEFKDYSKSYYGRYIRSKREDETPRIYIYIYRSKYCNTMYEYEDIFSTMVHEICHHIQHSDPEFIRRKGVMHDKQFWDLYNKYMNLYFELNKSAEKGARYNESIKKANRASK